MSSRMAAVVAVAAFTFAVAAPAALAAAPVMRVSGISSPPANARAGHVYTLHGRVTNSGPGLARGIVTARLVRSGHDALVAGRRFVAVGSYRSARYEVTIRVPSDLAYGSYAVVACTERADMAGAESCATAGRRIESGPGDPAIGAKAAAQAHAAAETCSSGAHTLSRYGDHVYPEMGNGGYTSVHTDVHIAYDAVANLFLPGTHVDLTDRATQCLTDFSLDFERSSNDAAAGPNMTVGTVTVNGQPAAFTFVQPTYPGDPNGQDDPDPLAHQASQLNPVSATNPLPPACAPQVFSGNANSQNGTPCPANKLVITPASPIASGATFTVTVNYTGRPGVHRDGDSTTEGWFRSNSPAGDGSFVTTEPVGTMAWMPLNNHPTAKPTYDFYDTVTPGRTAIANGELAGFSDNPPDANFAAGSRTWHWHSPEPIASYLVENSVGGFDLVQDVDANGIVYYAYQGSGISQAQKTANLAIMTQQKDLVAFQSQFNGPFPFSTDGVVVGVPTASFQEEMQTKITFNGGRIGLQTFHHENMHQWWGDNVAESNFNLTFFKEGFAVLGEYLYLARNAEQAAIAAGGDAAAGRAAFEASLVSRFNLNYNQAGSFWTGAPSNPTPATLFSTSSTYTRPATALIALRQILGKDNFNGMMMRVQRDYGGGTITEPQLIAAFHEWMPNQSAECAAKLDQFFRQWWDTAYPSGGGLNKPRITGPGLAGQGFYDATGGCSDVGVTSVSATVPAQFALTLGDPVSLGVFTPGVARDYTASTTANVISTAGDAALTVSDPGHLANGTFTLPQPLQVTGLPKTYDGPVSNDVVTIGFKQPVGAGDALRTGTYSRTLTFTLSTDRP